MSMNEIDALFSKTLKGDYNDQAPWEAVRALQEQGSREVLEKAKQWCASDNALERARAADVLAQLGVTMDSHGHSFPEEAYAALERLLQKETEPRPIASAVCALGHLRNPLAIPLITEFLTHPAQEVRFSLAFAMESFPDDPQAVSVLLRLMEDSDKEVRNWATFGIGTQSNMDSAEIRDALAARLNDTDADAKLEAIVGLAKRKDKRVLPALLAALTSSKITMGTVEAARMMLDMEEDNREWTGKDYARTLRKTFPA